jgi:serine/threonine protein phosphatase PrpC
MSTNNNQLPILNESPNISSQKISSEVTEQFLEYVLKIESDTENFNRKLIEIFQEERALRKREQELQDKKMELLLSELSERGKSTVEIIKLFASSGFPSPTPAPLEVQRSESAYQASISEPMVTQAEPKTRTPEPSTTQPSTSKKTEAKKPLVIPAPSEQTPPIPAAIKTNDDSISELTPKTPTPATEPSTPQFSSTESATTQIESSTPEKVESEQTANQKLNESIQRLNDLDSVTSEELNNFIEQHSETIVKLIEKNFADANEIKDQIKLLLIEKIAGNIKFNEQLFVDQDWALVTFLISLCAQLIEEPQNTESEKEQLITYGKILSTKLIAKNVDVEMTKIAADFLQSNKYKTSQNPELAPQQEPKESNTSNDKNEKAEESEATQQLNDEAEKVIALDESDEDVEEASEEDVIKTPITNLLGKCLRFNDANAVTLQIKNILTDQFLQEAKQNPTAISSAVEEFTSSENDQTSSNKLMYAFLLQTLFVELVDNIDRISKQSIEQFANVLVELNTHSQSFNLSDNTHVDQFKAWIKHGKQVLKGEKKHLKEQEEQKNQNILAKSQEIPINNQPASAPSNEQKKIELKNEIIDEIEKPVLIKSPLGTGYAYCNKAGRPEKANEDRVLYVVGEDKTRLSVIDGMGGYNGGNLAAEAVAKAFLDTGLKHDVCIGIAKSEISNLQFKEAGACALVIDLVRNDDGIFEAEISWVGDTRLTIIRPKSVKELRNADAFKDKYEKKLLQKISTSQFNLWNTADLGHAYWLNVANRYEVSEKFLEDNYYNDSDIHVVSSAITGQDNSNLDISFVKLQLEEGDVLVLATDGLSDNYKFSELPDLIGDKSLRHAANFIQTDCLSRMNQNTSRSPKEDNLGFIVFKVGSSDENRILLSRCGSVVAQESASTISSTLAIQSVAAQPPATSAPQPNTAPAAQPPATTQLAPAVQLADTNNAVSPTPPPTPVATTQQTVASKAPQPTTTPQAAQPAVAAPATTPYILPTPKKWKIWEDAYKNELLLLGFEEPINWKKMKEDEKKSYLQERGNFSNAIKAIPALSGTKATERLYNINLLAKEYYNLKGVQIVGSGIIEDKQLLLRLDRDGIFRNSSNYISFKMWLEKQIEALGQSIDKYNGSFPDNITEIYQNWLNANPSIVNSIAKNNQ